MIRSLAVIALATALLLASAMLLAPTEPSTCYPAQGLLRVCSQ